MNTKQSNDIIAQEAFIKRAAIIDMPFALKGSFLTRQYFDNPNDRIPSDLDWIYLEQINESSVADEIFHNWLTQVTQLDMDDEIKFDTEENWDLIGIDYAMGEDFPTLNTFINYEDKDGKKGKFQLDISFNLKLIFTSQPLNYKTLDNDIILLNRTIPLHLQVSWKIHQTLVRPRLKDLFDLQFLIKHKDFTEETADKTMQALVDECHRDDVDRDRIIWFLQGNIEKIYQSIKPDSSLINEWNHWIGEKYDMRAIMNLYTIDRSWLIIEDGRILPDSVDEFISEFNKTVEESPLIRYLTLPLPQPL
jgi:Nucleotidyl transferase AbiEii toxin, Type IV TA system